MYCFLSMIFLSFWNSSRKFLFATKILYHTLKSHLKDFSFAALICDKKEKNKECIYLYFMQLVQVAWQLSVQERKLSSKVQIPILTVAFTFTFFWKAWICFFFLSLPGFVLNKYVSIADIFLIRFTLWLLHSISHKYLWERHESVLHKYLFLWLISLFGLILNKNLYCPLLPW